MSETAGPDPVDAEFVTVAEAARALGIAPRQVRRYAAKLGHGDRQEGGQGQGQTGDCPPLRVRFSAILSLRNQGQAGGMGRGQAEDRPQDTVPSSVSRTLDADREMLVRLEVQNDALIARLADRDAEIARLATALTREQETAAKLADRLADADARLAAVLVRQLPAAGTGAGQDAPTDAQKPESGTGEGAGDRTFPVQPVAEEKPSGFWARLLGRR